MLWPNLQSIVVLAWMSLPIHHTYIMKLYVFVSGFFKTIAQCGYASGNKQTYVKHYASAFSSTEKSPPKLTTTLNLTTSLVCRRVARQK